MKYLVTLAFEKLEVPNAVAKTARHQTQKQHDAHVHTRCEWILNTIMPHATVYLLPWVESQDLPGTVPWCIEPSLGLASPQVIHDVLGSVMVIWNLANLLKNSSDWIAKDISPDTIVHVMVDRGLHNLLFSSVYHAGPP